MLQYEERKKMGKEKFHAPKAALRFSVESVSLTLAPGEIQEGSFIIYSSGSEVVDGFVTSSRLCMKCVSSSFSGSRDEISYRFDASSFAAGDSVEGYFRIISNQGEYKLPFDVKVMARRMETSLGAVRNLYHFANLAKTNWREAVEVFYNPDFASVFTVEEKKEKALWRGLSAHQGNMQNVEEFLIAAGKKTAVEFLPEVTQLEVELPLPEEKVVSRPLRIRRNGWGYTRLEIATEGTFLSAGQKVLDAVSFREGSADLAVLIDPARLHAGLNLGSLVLKAPFGEQRIPVSVRYMMSTGLRAIHRHEERRLILELMRAYEDFRGAKMTGEAFLAAVGPKIRRLYDLDRNYPYAALYRIHYLVSAHKVDDALMELQNLNRRLAGDTRNLPLYTTTQFALENEVEYCYRLYLTILCLQEAQNEPAGTLAGAMHHTTGTEDQTGQQEDISGPPLPQRELWQQDFGRIIRAAQAAVGGLRRRYPDNGWIAWLSLYSGTEGTTLPEQTLRMLSHQFDRGWRSPLLYIEALDIFQNDPALLSSCGEFEEQVLLYAARHQRLSDALLTQVNYVASREKNSSEKLLRVLMDGYAQADIPALQKDTLSAICALLIRDNETDSRYFTWYQKGVEEQLPITRLFDYYMMSMPSGYHGRIPQMVIMYFAFQSSLPYERNAVLYRYVVEHRQDIGDIYGQYRERLDSFTERAILSHRMDPDVTVLYDRYLSDGRVLTAEAANAAVPAVFTIDLEVGKNKTGGSGDDTHSVAGTPTAGGNPDSTRTLSTGGNAEDAGVSREGGNAGDAGVSPAEGDADGERSEAAPESSLQFDPRRIRRVVVQYAEYESEQYYPVENGRAYLPLYSDTALLLLEDNGGNRYAVSVPYSVHRMMDAARLSRTLNEYPVSNVGFDLYLSSLPEAGSALNEKSEPRLASLLGSSRLSGPFRQKVLLSLLQYYEATDADQKLDALLNQADSTALDADARAALIQAMCRRGLYSRALSWVKKSGAFGIDGETLLRLCSGILAQQPVLEDAAFAEIAHEGFLKGKYDEAVLQYMSRWFDGLTSELEAIRNAMLRFDMDTGELSLRMLIQLLFTGAALSSREEIIDCCMDNGAPEDLLASALAQSSHYYFVAGRPMGRRQFARIARYGMDGVPLVDICRIAWLKDRSERSGAIQDAELEVTRLFLEDLLAEGIIFPFFRQYLGLVPELAAYEDETLVEYHALKPVNAAAAKTENAPLAVPETADNTRTALSASPEADDGGRSDKDPQKDKNDSLRQDADHTAPLNVVYHYAMEKNGRREKYTSRRMKEMYEGVYVTGFLLFFGEQIAYYITDDVREQHIVESGTIGQDARISGSGKDRFGMLNEISMLAAMGRDEEALEKIRAYAKRSYLVESLFGDKAEQTPQGSAPGIEEK